MDKHENDYCHVQEEMQALVNKEQYYKQKYEEMQELMQSSQKQLADFNEVNEMSKKVIDNLQNEIRHLKNKNDNRQSFTEEAGMPSGLHSRSTSSIKLGMTRIPNHHQH